MASNTDLAAYQPLNIAFSIRSAACRAPGKIAIRDGARHLTYGGLVDRIDRVTAAIARDRSIAAGDRILLLSPNCLEFMEVVAGAAQGGIAVALPATRASAREIAAIMADSQPKLAIVHPSLRHLIESADVPIVIFGPAYEAWLEAASPGKSSPLADELETFAIPYTSGTTGKPKGVMLSSRSRILTAYAMAVEFECFGRDDRHLAIAPLYHGGGLSFALATLLFGGTLDVMAKFDAEEVIRYLATERITSTFMVPTHFSAIFNLDGDTLEKFRQTSLKSIISNAAALPTNLKERAIDYWGEGKLYECYGGTEPGIISVIRPADQRRKMQCVGQLFPDMELSLRDPAGVEVAPGDIGEVWTRSPFGFNGYLNLPDQTAETINDGWISVGDLGRLDDENYLYIVGRQKDMVISGGVNIYPSEIETALEQHPEIIECAVVGIPDNHWGESLKAFVVLQQGSSLDPAAITDFSRQYLSSIKVPRAVSIIPALPKSATGKILKTELRKL